MAWSDEPTLDQLAAVGRLIQWQVDNPTQVLAMQWLKNHATRREVSFELKRLRDLYIDHKLNKDNVFASDIWEGFLDE